LHSQHFCTDLNPALCATLLKPIEADHQKKGFFAWFDRFLTVNKKYEAILVKLLNTFLL
jgi:multidrug efflux pump